MATIQKRIYELQTYSQLISGDPGHIPATSVFLAVDYNGWTEAKKMTLDDFFGTVLHLEAGKLSNLSSLSVARVFDTAFTGVVIDRVAVYREISIGGKLVRNDVLFHDLAVTLLGFTLEIDTTENLAGIIIDYQMMEAQ